ncbi:MAG: ankyrin repeat domain-containing protein [Acidobacteriota bacterium]
MTNQLDQQLRQAAQTGNLEAVDEALNRGANFNTPDEIGDTALNLAAEFGHIEVVLRLLDARADNEHLGGGQKTPLMNATFAGQTPVVKLLLSRGARINRDLLSSLELKVSIAEENTKTDLDYVASPSTRSRSSSSVQRLSGG